MTIYMGMVIQQAFNGKSVEAIVVKKEKNANKVNVTDLQFAEKWFNRFLSAENKVKYYM